MIRFATEGDIPELIRRQQSVSDTLPHPDGIGFNERDAAESMAAAIRHPNMDIIIGDRGAIGLELGSVWFDRSARFAKAFFFWSNGDGPILIEAACEWTLHMGASRLRADAQEYRVKATERAYRKYGLRPVERMFERVL